MPAVRLCRCSMQYHARLTIRPSRMQPCRMYLNRARSQWISHDVDFCLQADTMCRFDLLLHMFNQLFVILGRSLAVIDNEIGMLAGHLCPADAVTLKARRLDKAAG